MENHQVTIDLNRKGEVIFDTNSLVQIKSYKKLYEIFKNFEQMPHNEEKDRKGINALRKFDNILISGERGAGKTVFINNIKKQIIKFDTTKNLIEKTYFLPPIDPTLITQRNEPKLAESYCFLFISHLVNALKIEIESANDGSIIEEYYSKLNEMSETLSCLMKDDNENTSGMNKLFCWQDATKAEEEIHETLELISTKILKKKRICFIFDDIDMSLGATYPLLEAIRKYLSSPYCFCILTGNIDQLKEMVEYRFMNFYESKFVYEKYQRNNEIISTFYSDIERKSDEYLDKILPISNRIYLQSFEELFYDNELKIQYLIEGSKKLEKEKLEEKLQGCIFQNSMKRSHLGEIATNILSRDLKSIYGTFSLRNALQFYYTLYYTFKSESIDKMYLIKAFEQLLDVLGNRGEFSLLQMFIKMELTKLRNYEKNDENIFVDFIQKHKKLVIDDWIPSKKEDKEYPILKEDKKTIGPKYNSFLHEMLYLEYTPISKKFYYINPFIFLVKYVCYYIYTSEELCEVLSKIDSIIPTNNKLTSQINSLNVLLTSEIIKKKIFTSHPDEQCHISASDCYFLCLAILEICRKLRDVPYMIENNHIEIAKRLIEDLIEYLDSSSESSPYKCIKFDESIFVQ